MSFITFGNDKLALLGTPLLADGMYTCKAQDEKGRKYLVSWPMDKPYVNGWKAVDVEVL